MTSPAEDRPAPPAPEVDADRRRFLKLAGGAGLATALGALTAACEAAESITPAPAATISPAPPASPPATTPTRVPEPTPQPAVTPAPGPATTPRAIPSPPEDAGSRRIAHLLRRAGFGASRQEMEFFRKKGLPGAVDYLVNYETVDDSDLEERLRSVTLDLTKRPDLQRWWLLRMIYTRRPLQEKMVLFWHGLLTSGFSRVGRADRMLQQNEIFRRQALGPYDALLKAISRDPAMLIWLDSRNNRKAAPNENFARELMELFTMGPGNYTEEDIRESARAFTGYFLNPQGFLFNRNQHDGGTKTFLGASGQFGGDDIIDIIMKQPATAEFLCRKLFGFFAYENPEAEVLSRLTATFRANNYSIKAVVREILTSEAFYSDTAYRSRPKSPVELVAGSIRTLGIETDAAGLPVLLSRMGQTIFDPPNVAGWPGGAVWFNSSTLLERINLANRLSGNRRSFNPLEDSDQTGNGSPRELLDRYLGLLLDGNISPELRLVFDDYAASSMKAGVGEGPARVLVYLILSSPDYQLA